MEKDRLPQRNGSDIRFETMIEEIEKHDGFGDKVFSQLKHNSWKAMNSFTHGGMQQVFRRLKGDSIEPNYDDEEVIEVLRAGGTFALLALQHAAQMAKRADVVATVQHKLSEGAKSEKT